MEKVKQFYNQIQFPGNYTAKSLDYHCPKIRNPYLQIINRALENGIQVIDIGCGTGLITNLFAKKYPGSQFFGVDFANSIDHAVMISQELDLSNTQFFKEDFVKLSVNNVYDVAICQGVLHHMPDYKIAIKKIINLIKPGGTLVLGLYHPWGKIVKKYVEVNYQDPILYQDQEKHPFETAFCYSDVTNMLGSEFLLDHAYPSILGSVALPSVFNFKNGGLVTYVFKKN